MLMLMLMLALALALALAIIAYVFFEAHALFSVSIEYLAKPRPGRRLPALWPIISSCQSTIYPSNRPSGSPRTACAVGKHSGAPVKLHCL